MEKLVLRRGFFFEGTRQGLRAIYPTPVISPALCDFIKSKEVLFREDSFDPVTRIRRGRLYVEEQHGEKWSKEQVDPGIYRPQPGDGPSLVEWTSEVSYAAWQTSNVTVTPEELFGA